MSEKNEVQQPETPLNIRILQAKAMVNACIENVAVSCKLPGPVMELILEGILLGLKNTNLDATVIQYDSIVAGKDMEIKALSNVAGKEAKKDGK